ncbi:hybrid sensor histidine kinase/response regulator [Pseudoponticoccus marisrubri]|uniref:histidine kinase n=1 Tax=Pseudoponticoccus marisrubri TaxID=1685382 RepID=A0A0W7WQV2_9RHOB|nr:hybrid sensor histidine kinase/response regulator [Pseudoponticoccus marisrubri]
MSLVAIAFLVSEIVRELRFLSTANSDNVHWTLSQAEVEFLEFQHAVDAARVGDTDDLTEVIVEFDVFYSRMATLAQGSLYADLRDQPDFLAPLQRIRAQLDALIPLIDGSASDLRAELDRLSAEIEEMRLDVRLLSTNGLQFFARQSDASRNSVAVTLLRLALITIALVLALVLLLRHARRVGQQTEQRGQELATAYARLNTIMQTSLDAVIVTDLKGRIVSFNAAAERIFQHLGEDVIGRSIGDVIVPPHLREAHETGMKRMRETGEHRVVGHGRVRLEGMRGDGSIFPVELAIEKAVSGEDEFVVAFLRDISHRVAAENELVAARDEALAGEHAKAEFLAMMTHEIRTPLNGILGNLSLLEDTRLDAAQGRYVRNMDISGKLLMRHVDSVLDVARFESGADGAAEDEVHLGRLIQDIVDSQSSAAEAQGNTLSWGWAGDPVGWIRIDSSRLQQVLLNLVGNAIKFTRGGRITIEAESVEGEAGPEIELRIIDTGIGISEEDQARVFEDFQTVDSVQTDSIGGTGLGLGIVRRFVQAMQGEIGVESAPGDGSVFWLRLPIEHVTGPADDPAIQADADAQAVRDILLVEDNEINVQLAHEVLMRMGHRVTIARDGQAGVEAASERRFDLILMDIRMPVLDGLGATRAIREGDGPNRDVPIIAFSANVLPEAKDRFLAAGMSDFLGKPLQKAELQQVIARFGTSAPAPAKPAPSAPAPAPAASKPAPADPLAGLAERHRQETQALFDWLATAPADHDQIADRAHQVAGSAAAFGQPGLRDALVALERAAETGTPEDLAEATRQAHRAWQKAPAPSLG